MSVLDVPEPVLGPGHVDAVQDRLLHAVPGEQGDGPEQRSIITLLDDMGGQTKMTY